MSFDDVETSSGECDGAFYITNKRKWKTYELQFLVKEHYWESDFLSYRGYLINCNSEDIVGFNEFDKD